ncbi:ABC transporter ATP-binding protein [Lacrimispora sp.]|uniref:ABC transporter ATP-binding protein n=1 Tax=Lacrimispora sp. TaxID=2719234 RepID=UPI0028AAC451|nr:ABC transporter ATP-binding protein [Lacrimispora sp.]
MNSSKILEIKNLSVTFRTSVGEVPAVRGLDLDLKKGEIIAIVGESGSGKSATARAIMGLLENNGKIKSGMANFTYSRNGETVCCDLLSLSRKEIRKHINGRRIAMVFQDPMTSLDPTMTIGKQLTEGMVIHYKTPKKEAWRKASELLEMVGIHDAEKRMKNYPHQLSGGMRQRVVIAIALSCNPDILICDEPTTALDVTIQAKILDLIAGLQRKTGVSVIYITHDLGVVARVADYVAVMYAGRIVEKGTANEIFYHARHPYTWGLLSAMPSLDSSGELYVIPGSPPDLSGYKGGDPFADRNAYALNIDRRIDPPMFRITETHYAATWLLDPRAPKVSMPAELEVRIRHMRKEEEYGI